jgi:hypothetical protein
MSRMPPRAHVVIRRADYVAGSAKRPEVGVFTQAHTGRPPVPWGRIATGETVWMKWTNGPIVAKATVRGFTQIEGYRLHALTAYWDSLMRRGPFFGMAVFLDGEEWLDEARTPTARSHGESWFVLDTAAMQTAWLGEVADTLVGRGSRTIPEGLRFKVLRRDGFACVYCGRGHAEGVRLQIDHVVAWSRGGRTGFENLRTSCAECTRGKGASGVA